MAERDKGSGYVEMVELEMPELNEQNSAEWVNRVYVEATGDALSYANHFGCCPYWAQQDATPTDPSGEPM